jgi:hypothetical protein
MSQSLAGGRALAASSREANRVAALAPKHAAGRARRAMRVQALAGTMLPARASSSYMGQRLVARPAAPSMYVAKKSFARGKQTLVITSMFERFTEKAIKVVMLAQEEARRLGHNFVGTEQILLGLIGESTGIAAKVLKSMGVNLKDARVEVEKIIGRGSGFVAVEIPFTPRAKRVLELSLEEARQLGAWRFAGCAARAGTHSCRSDAAAAATAPAGRRGRRAQACAPPGASRGSQLLAASHTGVAVARRSACRPPALAPRLQSNAAAAPVWLSRAPGRPRRGQDPGGIRPSRPGRGLWPAAPRRRPDMAPGAWSLSRAAPLHSRRPQLHRH